jgi:hypothetical protein
MGTMTGSLPRVEVPEGTQALIGRMHQVVTGTPLRLRVVAYCQFGCQLYQIEPGQDEGKVWYRAWDCVRQCLVELDFGRLMGWGEE